MISKIALYPHPNLNEYLLNPSIPLRSGTSSLFSILHNIVDQLQVSVAGIRDLKTKLILVRRSLLGHQIESDSNQNLQTMPEIDSNEKKVLQTLVVVEEFGKELSAIAFVQNQHFI